MSAQTAWSALLRERRAAARGFERPQIFDRTRLEDAEALRSLLHANPDIRVADELTLQVAELVHARDPAHKRKSAHDDAVLAHFLDGQPRDDYGRWVYFPWRRCLVHLLPEAEFVELRTARNQLHVSAHEQRALRDKRVGVVGVSVGYAMAVTMALEGVGGHFRLADFDRLELSNTNRVASGVLGLGHNKAVLAARSMFEIDPYLQIEVFEAGIATENARAFFTRAGQLDVLIEECDDLPMKLRLRELARELGVPVITETSQRGLLDLERFDLEPHRPPFHGLLGDVRANQLAQLSTREKAPFLLRFLQGTAGMSSTLAASLVEIERSLAGWPQLASAVTLGGAVVTETARRLLLGHLRRSGRFRIDTEAIVSDDAPAELREPVVSMEHETVAHGPADDAAPHAPRETRGMSLRDRLPHWVRWATLAPSGGNAQPWLFEERSDHSLTCRLAPRAKHSALDPEARAARLACGAAAENLTLAAGRDGFRSELTFQPDASDPDLLFHCQFSPDPGLVPDPLASYVPARRTNRRISEREPLTPEHRACLQSEAERAGAALLVHESEAALQGIGRVLGELERVRLFSEELYREMMAELADAPDATLGISLDTLELSAADRAALQILRRRDVVALLRAEQRGAALCELAQKPVRAASAVCLLHSADPSAHGALAAGLALQRVWLRATQLGLALQPISAGLYMLQQLEDGASRLTAWERAELARLRPEFEAYFGLPPERRGALVFRLFRAADPSARSARLSVEELFTRAELEVHSAE
jgi:ThiF family